MNNGKTRLRTLMSAEFVRYMLAGVVNTGLSYVFYFLLLTWLPYQVAYAIAYIAGIGTQFLLHTCFVFRVPPTVTRLSGYPLIHLLLYAYGAALLHTLVEMLGVKMSVAGLVVIIASFPVGFLLTRIWLKYESNKKLK